MKQSLAQRSIEGPVNRPLTDFEKTNQLDNHILGKGIPLTHSNLIIRMNSTFLEMPQDGFPNHRINFGMAALFMLVPIVPISIILFDALSKLNVSFITIAIFGFLWFLAVFLGSLLFKISFFNYTHRPIRFNRKQQCVHFFRFDGSQLTVPWKDIVFTCSKKNILQPVYIAANIIDPKTGIMTERFFLPEMTVSPPFFHAQAKRHYYPDLVSIWAFIVEYMEGNNLPELTRLVYYCIPIAKKKESPYWSMLFSLSTLNPQFSRYYTNFSFLFEMLFFVISFPILLLTNLTNKFPRWNPEIESMCQIEPNDPINLSNKTNPTGWKLFRYVTSMLTLQEFSHWLEDMKWSESLSRSEQAPPNESHNEK
ncbi:DUF6708 domain-containing protein [Thorsellia anophelis]|uniref:DUF6708 domain-containing protein n=1 Tax=Thorsellia anophelis DSM 18579 TaxID=1123402 RepID=A0A1I0FQF5_9GAMM|nr:DUF6708 domain-containing protein [Thorsellia anophelis]SET60615.1 hypothetical protein SAMN02583745_02859 [Thorsellia anophelis DSM 18579]